MGLPLYSLFVMGVGILSAAIMVYMNRPIAYTEAPRTRQRPGASSSDSSQNRKLDRCVVCLNEMLAARHTYPCNHTIHRKCYEELVIRHEFGCPLCGGQ